MVLLVNMIVSRFRALGKGGPSPAKSGKSCYEIIGIAEQLVGFDQLGSLPVIDNQRWHATGFELLHQRPGPLDALAVCRQQLRIRCRKASGGGTEVGPSRIARSSDRSVMSRPAT